MSTDAVVPRVRILIDGYRIEVGAGHSVWLKMNISDAKDGVCIGCGDTNRAAIDSAIDTLMKVRDKLEGCRP